MSDRSYTPVRITTIKAERVVSFPVYIFFKDQYLEYVQPGSSIEKEKYQKLRKQKITKFFIKEADELSYQDFLDSFIEETLNSSTSTVEEKTEAVTGMSETAIERLSDDPASEASFDLTRKASKNLQKLIFENPESLANIFSQDSESGPIISHSMNVCVLSIKFGKKKKLSDEQIDYLSTAALMHDIGLMERDKQVAKLFDVPKSEFQPQQKIEYNDHCKGVVTLLSERPYINKAVIDLIESHEENLQGSGPLKMKKLTPSQEILSLINTYDKKCVTQKIGPAEALKELMIDELGNYNLNLLNEFKGFLKEEKLI